MKRVEKGFGKDDQGNYKPSIRNRAVSRHHWILGVSDRDVEKRNPRSRGVVGEIYKYNISSRQTGKLSE